MPPSGSIAFLPYVMIGSLLILGYLFVTLWRRPSWHSYWWGLAGCVAWAAFPALLGNYLLTVFAGYGWVATPLYVLVGLAIVIFRRKPMATA